MPNRTATPSAGSRRASLRREIVAILSFKLLALIALRVLFFDERPQITPAGVEALLFAPAPETTHDRR